MATALLERVRRGQSDAVSDSSGHPFEDPRTVVHAIGARDDCERTWEAGLALIAAPIVLLAALRPDWKTVAGFIALESVGAVVATFSEISAFRRRLDVLEPLPSEAVEVTRRPRRRNRRPRTLRQALAALAVIPALVVGNAVYFLEDEREWVERIGAILVATFALGLVVRPLVEGALVARWERRHPHARLFRLTDTDDEDAEKQLYVSTHPVVAA